MSQRIGPYRVVRPLALGGMGETLLAEHPAGQLVVLKRLLPHLAGDDEAERCFREERRIAGRLDHPNIVRFLDATEHDRQTVLVFEYVDGCSARDLLKGARDSGKPLDVAEACAIVEAVARGLHYAHCVQDDQGNPLGLIHRDVSPANILISLDGEVKIIDFGVAKAWDAEGRTATGVVKGKAGYMSPEHTLCEPIDARADVFSLGIVLWELLVGDRLFVASGPVAIAYQVLESAIPKPSSRRQEIPARVDAICMHALERSQQTRTESAGALEQSLALWRQETGQQADLGELIRRRFPYGVPSEIASPSNSQPGVSTQVSDGQTLVEGGGPRGAPLPPPPAPPLLELADPPTSINEDLGATTIDLGIQSHMRGVRRRSTFKRVLMFVAVLALAAGVVLSARYLPPGLLGGEPSAPAVFFAYTDDTGAEIIVASLADVPVAQRPSARRIDLDATTVTFENSNTDLTTRLTDAVQQLQRELAPPARARVDDPTALLTGLAVPLAGLLVLGALVFWLLARIRDGFVRMSLRLLVVFLLGVGLFRVALYGALGRPGISALVGAHRTGVPVDRLAPDLRQHIRRLIGETDPTTSPVPARSP